MVQHNVIQNRRANDVEGLFKGTGQCAISLAGFWVGGGLVMNQDHSRGAVFQRNLHHFPWIHSGPFQRASE